MGKQKKMGKNSVKEMVKRVLLLCLFGSLLSACASERSRPVALTKAASPSHDRVRFYFPASVRWEPAQKEQDAEGYAWAWRPVVVPAGKGKKPNAEAEQSVYVNFGRGIKTPLYDAMQEVGRSMRDSGCHNVQLDVLSHAHNVLLFTASSKNCLGGHPVWQIFRVVNRPDGQYSIVYSVNPEAVPASVRGKMSKMVSESRVVSAKIP